MNKTDAFKTISIVFIVVSVFCVTADIFINITINAASIAANHQAVVWFFDSNYLEWYDYYFIFDIEIIKSIISPVTSIVSISFAVITFLSNNAKSVYINSVSMVTHNLIYDGVPKYYYIYFIPFLLLTSSVFKLKLTFYLLVLYVVFFGVFLVRKLYRYNSDKRLIYTLDDAQFKDSKKEFEPREIFAFIEIFFINNCEKLFFSDLSENFSKKFFKKISSIYEKTKDGYESFSELVTLFLAVFGDVKLSPNYRAKIFIYFLEEYESFFYISEGDKKDGKEFKIGEQKVAYEALLYTALFGDFDMNEIRKYYCSKKYNIVLRWLFAYYILLYNYYVDSYIKDIGRNIILHDCTKSFFYLNSLVTEEHNQFVKQSLYYVMKYHKCKYDDKLYIILHMLNKTGDTKNEK